jgi:hypothetical protein
MDSASISTSVLTCAAVYLVYTSFYPQFIKRYKPRIIITYQQSKASKNTTLLDAECTIDAYTNGYYFLDTYVTTYNDIITRCTRHNWDYSSIINSGKYEVFVSFTPPDSPLSTLPITLNDAIRDLNGTLKFSIILKA